MNPLEQSVLLKQNHATVVKLFGREHFLEIFKVRKHEIFEKMAELKTDSELCAFIDICKSDNLNPDQTMFLSAIVVEIIEQKKSTNKTNNMNRKTEISNAIGKQIADLISDHLERIEQCAVDSLDETSDKPAMAKAALRLEWAAGEPLPLVSCKIGYTVSIKDEISIDTGQQELPFEVVK
jgi:hypothetical protein